MKRITSTHNDIYKNLKQLATSAKHRKRAGQTLIEGIHLCESYLQHRKKPQMYVYTDAAAENAEAAEIIRDCDDAGVRGTLLSNAHFRAISSVDNGIGVALVVDIPSEVPPARLQRNAVLLEDVQDPGNMGTILRTAAAAGVTDIFISSGSSSAWSPKVLRASMGAHFALRIYENCDLAALISGAGVPVLATSLGATKTIYETELSAPTAWLFGNEGSGVSSELLALGVEQVVIPQSTSVESLNVSATVAICLYEQVRQVQSVKK